MFHEKTKYIEVGSHYIRQHVQSGVIKTHYVRSGDQLADAFTKALPTAQFSWLMSKLGSFNLLAPA